MTHFLIKKPIFLFNVEAIRGPVWAASEKSEVLKMFFLFLGNLDLVQKEQIYLKSYIV